MTQQEEFVTITEESKQQKKDTIHLQSLNTELARTELELYQSRAFLDSLIENLPAAIFVKEPKELRLIRVNRALEDLFGYTREQMLGKNDHDLFPKKQADVFAQADQQVFSGKKVIEIPEETVETPAGIKIMHTKKIALLNASGQVEYLLGIGEEITEKKRAADFHLKFAQEQAALRERDIANRRTTFLAEASKILAPLEYNETLKALVRLTVSFMADWSMITILREDHMLECIATAHTDPSKALSMEQHYFMNYKSQDPEHGIGFVIRTAQSLHLKRPSEDQFALDPSNTQEQELIKNLGTRSGLLVPIQIRGVTLGVISIASSDGREYNAEDLSLAEELGRRVAISIDNARLYLTAKKAIQVRDEFLSIASHELNTPLTTLKLQTQMRKRTLSTQTTEGFKPAELKTMFDSDEKQILRISRLIDDILDVTRLQSGKAHLRLEEIDLSNLIIDVLEKFTPQFKAASCEIIYDIQKSIIGYWDPHLLEQVLTNLLSNATKYSAGRPVIVTLKKSQSTILIHVKDHGDGISPKDQERIFQQFERAISGANKVSGLGLGLYIAQKMVQTHRGTIIVESELAQGATFTVELPHFTTKEEWSKKVLVE